MRTTLPPMSKDAEIAHYTAFVAALPDGYLRDMLRWTEDYVADLIRQDLCLPAIHIQHAERMTVRAEVHAAHAERARLDDDLRAKRRELDRLQASLADIRATARKMAAL